MLPKSAKSCSVADLKTENSSVYDQIFDLGRQSANAEIAKLKSENTIRKNAYKLNLGEFGEGLISEGLSVEAALESLIAESQKQPAQQAEQAVQPKQELKGILEATAAAPAGAGSDGDTVTPTSMEEAIALELRSTNGDKKQAVRNARKNYPKLFIPQD